MSTFAQKKNRPVTPSVRPPVKQSALRPSFAAASNNGTSFGHHFSQMPVHSPSAAEHAVKSTGKGESGGGDDDFTAIKGEPDLGNEQPTPMKGEDKKVKKVKKTEISPATAGSCGQYSWKVQFSVEN